MNATRQELIKRINSILEDVPMEKLAEVLDSFDHLKQEWLRGETLPDGTIKGSAEAFLKGIKEHPLIFEPGELDEILAYIQEMREMDMEDDRIFT